MAVLSNHGKTLWLLWTGLVFLGCFSLTGSVMNNTTPETLAVSRAITTSHSARLTNTTTSSRHVKAINTTPFTSNTTTVGDLPENWREFCTTSETFVEWHFTTLSADEVSDMIQISCRLQDGDHLMFIDFRNWTRTLKSRAKMAMKVVCDEGIEGAFHVPWPMKVRNLVYLEVRNCLLPDYYSEYFDQSLSSVPDQLRVLDLKKCMIQTDLSEVFYRIENLENSSRDVECGPLSLEKFVFSDVDFDITISDYDMYEQLDSYSEILWRKHRRLNHQCDFQELRYTDESYFRAMSGRHLYSIQEKSFYPKLTFYNLSNVDFNGIPLPLREWRRSMEKMTYLDLSHNNISEIDLTDTGFVEDGIGTINLQFNSIKQLRKSDLDTLRRIKSATIDIRNNLINCSCGMLQDFHEFLKTPDLGRYEYLRDLRCGWPEKYHGKRVSDLTEVQAQCTEGLFIMTGVLGCLMLFLVVVVIILWRFRREVVILVYTRLHILLPCQAVDSLESKDFDAFISYSSKDDDWVLKTLVKNLESQEDGCSGFKLCVHHRDFEIGAAIADNVVRSVESSRHTVMVLSRNFVQSEWCIYEFRTAMQQSLLERRKHLILIILEEVPKSELDADLRKCLETFTYIQAGETLFWDKLRYSLSVRNKRRSTKRSSSSSSVPSEREILKSSTNNNTV